MLATHGPTAYVCIPFQKHASCLQAVMQTSSMCFCQVASAGGVWVEKGHVLVTWAGLLPLHCTLEHSICLHTCDGSSHSSLINLPSNVLWACMYSLWEAHPVCIVEDLHNTRAARTICPSLILRTEGGPHHPKCRNCSQDLLGTWPSFHRSMSMLHLPSYQNRCMGTLRSRTSRLRHWNGTLRCLPRSGSSDFWWLWSLWSPWLWSLSPLIRCLTLHADRLPQPACLPDLLPVSHWQRCCLGLFLPLFDCQEVSGLVLFLFHAQVPQKRASAWQSRSGRRKTQNKIQLESR